MATRTPMSKEQTHLTLARTLVATLLFGLAATGARAQVDFTWAPAEPGIDQQVIFTIPDPSVTPVSWDFGGEDCDGTQGVFDCHWTPEYCRHITWSYSEPGPKTVVLVTEEGEVSHTVEVQDVGTCCTLDGPPSSAFSMSPNPAFPGQEVVFSDLSEKGLEPGDGPDLMIHFSPSDPEIGEVILFQITPVTSVASAQWDFGGTGCGDFEQEYRCEPDFTDCLEATYVYAGSGDKTVHLTIDDGAAETTVTVPVSLEGYCDDGGCQTFVDPPSRSFSHLGGTGSIAVSTGPECPWTAGSNVPWIQVISGGEGTGNGMITYAVGVNAGPPRTGRVTVDGRAHIINQDADDGGPTGDTHPESWSWTILDADQDIVTTASQQHFNYTFSEPGLYTVRLEASNCAGSDIETGFLVIREHPASAEGWMIPSAVHAPGLNQTRWRSDAWIFNPGDQAIDLELLFLPENTPNWLSDHPTLALTIPPKGTAVLPDLLELIPGVIVDDGAVIGSALLHPDPDHPVVPIVVSRTYNQTPEGTYGQFIPTVPSPPGAPDRLFLTGLKHNADARTNIRLANLGTEAVQTTLDVISAEGGLLGREVPQTVPPLSTVQINGIAEEAWAGTNLDFFSVRVDTDVDTVLAWASVVDNTTGDPVLYGPLSQQQISHTLWIPGVAHLSGANDSDWRSDATFFNPNIIPMDTDVRYLPSEDLGFVPHLSINNLQPVNVVYYEDILQALLPSGIQSKGTLVVDGPGQSPPLGTVVRTYNLDPEGGTYGQKLHVFEGTDLITEGRRAYLPGISLSADPETGFRSNVGVFSTAVSGDSELALTLYDTTGTLVADVPGLVLHAEQLLQFNVATRFSLGDVDFEGTVAIEVLSGGPVAAYASVVDNRTQDPILIPAVPEAD